KGPAEMVQEVGERAVAAGGDTDGAPRGIEMRPRPGTLLAWLLAALLLVPAMGSAQDTDLPQGDAPAALTGPYFPDRVHGFVWRNWNVVPREKLARVAGTSAREIDALAQSMGLPPAAPVPSQMLKRGYITLLRRNWHLLPYEQLLQLVEMTPAQLAFSLRED